MSYAELSSRADRLARHLCALGVGPEVLVGVLCRRTPGMVAAALAVLKAGGAYLPLDPAHPADRLRFLLADSGATVVLAEESVAGALPPFTGTLVLVGRDSESAEDTGQEPPRGFVHPEQAAYAIYTSGSTGVPKGVLIRHGSAVNRIVWALSAYAPEVLAGVLAATSLCFDLSVFEIFVPLAGGGTIILADDALALPSLPAASAVTLVNTVPSAMAELVRAGALPRSVRVVNLAGEPLRRSLAEEIYAQGVEEVHNLYGPSEDTTYSTGAQARRGDEREPAIGRPLPNTRAYLLDSGLRPVPVGTPGELWLGGEGLARGYLRRPDLTADRFRPDPFGPLPGSRLYRTGDLARSRADGSLDYLGRLDHQVKIRGFRIELGEIESALLAHPGVRQAAVEAREIAGSKALVAYVAGEEPRPAAAELREHLHRRLPEHMIPAFFVALPELPLTPNGKVDRKALPAPEPRSAEEGRPAARTPVEEVLAGIWAEVLGLEKVNVQDRFFDLGGHSLLATRVVSRLRSVFGVELPLRDLFAGPSLGDLAVRVEAALRAGTPQTAPPLAPRPREEPQPLSFAQQRLWFIDQLEPGSPQYNMPVELRIEGPLDCAVLARCLGEIVRRHEALRTVFAELEGTPVQVIQPPAPFVPPLVDLSGLPERARASAAARLAGAEAVRPFDLIHGPLLRGVLLRLAEGDHTAALTLHHIVSDGWSMGILAREVTALYPAFAAGRLSPLPELPVQYADFAAWQRSWLQGEVLENAISFWRRELAGLPPLLELPTDRPRPAVQSFRGATRPVRLPAGLIRRLEALARREGATLFMVLLAGLQTLLARTSGRDDLVVGSPVAGRNWAEIEELIGFFVNTLVLRSHLRGDPTFRELLGRVRETSLAAYLHQEVPFEKLVEELAPERSLAHTPLFQVLLVLQNAPLGSLEIEGLRLRPVAVEGTTAKLDLTVSFSEHHGGLSGTIAYATDLFDPTTIDRLAGQLERLLAGMANRPDEPSLALPLLSPAERAQLLREWNDTRTIEPGESFFHHEVAAQAARTPEAVAVETEDERWTYGRLLAAARRLAQRLRELGVGPDAVVGLCAGRTPAMIAGLLAVLEAGGAWLPLDPDEPPERLRFLLDNADARVLLVAEPLRERVPAGGRPVVLLDAQGESGEAQAAPLKVELNPDHLAYVLYTSGSTGRPKGVAVRHSSLMHLARALRATVYAGTTTALRVGVNASFSFDGAVKQLVQLAWGHTLHILSREVRLDPPALVDTVRRQRLEVLDSTPSQLRLLLDAGLGLEDAAPALVLVGGEAVTAELRDAALSRSRTCFWNVYGPTECTVDTTAVPFAAGVSPSHIGRPLPNVQAHVVTGGGDLAPLGVSGELQVGGAGLARGYLHRPDLTAERFVPDPFGESRGGRLYRTGDLVRRLPGGSLDFLGRIDHQIKIRGFRIELGEIEAVLRALPGVREAAVLAHEARAGTGPGDRCLVAYVAGDIATDVLLQALREQLPG
ncbi:MAG TPA: amino acid adenylation domain-containing protein, partial [Thermoanaerobaculia bacterium]|nr:amino acid adenylation domain-containing protein [Thermoanaerobaculia bacterium]